MHTIEVGTSTRHVGRAVRADLDQLDVQVRFLAPSLPVPLVLEWREDLRLVLDRGVPWVFGPAERDPLRRSGGASVLPRTARLRLKQIASSGVPFQRVAVAHEVDPDGPVRHRQPAPGAEPRPCPDVVARMLVGKVPAHPRVTGVLRALDWAVSGGPSAVRGAVEAGGRALDPIIFGVLGTVPPHEGQPCLWYPITAWRW